MTLQYLVFPSLVLATFVLWFALGRKISQKNVTKGCLFLSFYTLLAIHGCLASNEDRYSIPSENERSIGGFLKKNGSEGYQFYLIELEKEQFIRVRPWPENKVVFVFYNLYRNILLNSWLPEYIFNLNGQLVDWSTDNQDDPEYQKKWGYSIELKALDGKTITREIDNN